jgi:cytochrome c oxidase subunit 4
MTHDVAAQVRGYLAVFGTLLVLTLVTVGVSYLDLPEFETVIVALAIATAKASLVAMFFMHLKGERPMVTWPLMLTAFLFVSLLGFLLFSEADHLFGARFQDAFTSIHD